MEDRALEQRSLSDDVNNMTEGGVIDTKNQLKENTEVLETVKDQNNEIKIALNVIFEEVIEIKKKMYKREISLVAPQIEMNRLREDNDRTSLSENRKIFKRFYDGKEVACKRISIPNDDEKWKMTKNRINVFNTELYQLNRLIDNIEDYNTDENIPTSEETSDDEDGLYVSNEIPPLIPPLEDGLRAHRN
ncbi:16279_t:CDS:2, partial [Racocetra fulgida]